MILLWDAIVLPPIASSITSVGRVVDNSLFKSIISRYISSHIFVDFIYDCYMNRTLSDAHI